MFGRRLRQAVVAGYFYPEEPEALRQDLGRLAPSKVPGLRAIGAIVPHAGYRFSGAIAGETFSRLAIPQCCVILAPNHTGLGEPWSLMAEGAYQTPLGQVPINVSLARALLEACSLLRDDYHAHLAEHAIEVELPFLQWLGPEALTIVPVVMSSVDPEECEQLASALACVIRQTHTRVLVVASSDLSHYEPQDVAVDIDARVIEAIHTLNARQFLQAVRDLKVTMCGHAAVACLLGAAQGLGATTATLIRYGTSAEAGGDPHAVVGYAGIVVN